MRVLVSGSAGTIGVVVAATLRRAGHEVVPFDLVDGDDVAGRRRSAAPRAAVTRL
jgi:nucleoside-diphosphate-sugar epimerase